MTQKLQITEVGLEGRKLIEASAGTGKTYTIANLYLRLLVEKDLEVSKILVVTYTKAATQELRGRVRKNLISFLKACEEEKTPDDESLALLMKQYRELGTLDQVVKKLKRQIPLMDESSIYTIHGFCQRVLEQFTFEAGTSFDSNILVNDHELREMAFHDSYRQFLKHAAENRQLIEFQYRNMPLHSLKQCVFQIAGKIRDSITPELDHDLLHQKISAFSKLAKTLTALYEEDLHLLPYPLYTYSQKNDKYKKYNINHWKALNLKIQAHMIHPDRFQAVELTGYKAMADRESVSNSYFQVNSNRENSRFLLALWDLSSIFHGHGKDDPMSLKNLLTLSIRTELTLKTEAYLQARKEELGLLGFDDLLKNVANALCGPQGIKLANKLLNSYPVGLIDEFQDTDGLQFNIFNKIYANSKKDTLFLIGDPKQAIYSFRGGDLHTYFTARESCEETFTLGENWRATPTLVDQVNSFFNREGSPFIETELSFSPVAPAVKKEQAMFEDDAGHIIPVNPFQICSLPGGEHGPMTNEEANQRSAALAAWQIHNLLLKGQAEACWYKTDDHDKQSVEPGDIAILVRSRFQAKHMRDALKKRGIPSVYFSRDLVFKTEEAESLMLLLQAVLRNGAKIPLQAALSSRILGYTLSEIRSLEEDDATLQVLVETMESAKQRWNQSGFLPMFHLLIHDLNIPDKLIADPEGERRLTNLFQLAELIHTDSPDSRSPSGVIRWFQTAMLQEGNDEAMLRLENDEHLVKIITLHKSKGLEYPIVFLPFSWSTSPFSCHKPPILYHTEQGERAFHLLKADDQIGRAAQQETLAEAIRLLYVGITRAKYLCVMTIAPTKGFEQSAVHQLFRDNVQSGATPDHRYKILMKTLENLGMSVSTFESLPDLPDLCFMEETESPTIQAFTRSMMPSWRMTSFSALTRGWDPELPDHGEASETDDPVNQNEDTIFTFPRGKHAGSFLHHVMENLDFQNPETVEPAVCRALQQFGFDNKWQLPITNHIQSVLNTDLTSSNPFKLADISKDKCMVEMGFHFPVTALKANMLNNLLYKEHTKLHFRQVNGMMKGFIDLIFEYGGAFFILDYKSNYHGHTLDSYTYEILEREMHHSGYDLQYLIYSLALVRFLRSRLPDFSFERDFGGVFYLYLRGMSPETGPSRGVYYTKPPEELINQLDQIMMGGDI